VINAYLATVDYLGAPTRPPARRPTGRWWPRRPGGARGGLTGRTRAHVGTRRDGDRHGRVRSGPAAARRPAAHRPDPVRQLTGAPVVPGIDNAGRASAGKAARGGRTCVSMIVMPSIFELHTLRHHDCRPGALGFTQDRKSDNAQRRNIEAISMSVRRIMGSEVEYGISVPGNPARTRW